MESVLFFSDPLRFLTLAGVGIRQYLSVSLRCHVMNCKSPAFSVNWHAGLKEGSWCSGQKEDFGLVHTWRLKLVSKPLWLGG